MANQSLKRLEKFGNLLVDGFHLFALFIIGITVIWSAAYEYFQIMKQGYATLKDILLLFLYLEIGAMIGIYFKTHRLPVRFLIYIAITALTRLLVVDIKELTNEAIITIAGATLLLVLSAYLLRYACPKETEEEKLY